MVRKIKGEYESIEPDKTENTENETPLIVELNDIQCGEGGTACVSGSGDQVSCITGVEVRSN